MNLTTLLFLCAYAILVFLCVRKIKRNLQPDETKMAAYRKAHFDAEYNAAVRNLFQKMNDLYGEDDNG